ncbi:hypothetical protein D3C75_1304330 [compost metagenome]
MFSEPDSERRVNNQAYHILGQPVLITVGEQAILLVAGILEISPGIYRHQRCPAAHGF